jgi:AcrR family transcriptional regulator
MAGVTSDTAGQARRPRDRKARIIAAAMECFHRYGYDATSMEDIAASVGFTAGALYRHFRGKQEILGQSLLIGLDLLAEAARRPEDLDALLRTFAAFCLDHRPHIGVWARQTRRLSAEHQAAVRECNMRIVAGIASALRRARPDLSAEDADLLGWAVLDVFASPAFHRTDLPRQRFEALLVDQAASLCRTVGLAPASPAGVRASQPAPGISPASRRQALINAAVPLFSRHGFANVSMDDIGAAAGVSGRSVYQYFAGKSDVLAASMHFVAGALRYQLLESLGVSRTPAGALDRILHGYARSALGHGSVEVWATELSHLPEVDREALFQVQSEYVAEWVALLSACRSDLEQAEARATVHSALTVINLMALNPPLRARADATDTLAALGLRVLGIGDDGNRLRS